MLLSLSNSKCLQTPRQDESLYLRLQKGDFKGLRSSLRAANLSNIISPHAADINDDWRC